MKVGHIFILGLIGTSYKEDGTVDEKGVELLDVVQQLNKLDKDVDEVHVHINSKGGYVTVGDAIAKLIGSIPNCFTIAENLCASIATKIHLSVPLQNRMIEAGTEYMIHNPFLASVSGDAQTLKDLSNSIQQTENELESMYAKATGLDKKIVSGLMAQTTFLTPEQCVELNFASKIKPKQQARAVALLYNEKEKEMAGKHTNRVSAALAVLMGNATVKAQNVNPLNNKERGAKALLISTDKGDIETPYEDLMIGDPVMVDGEAVEADETFTVTGGDILLIDGSTVSEGTVIEVKGGVVDNIIPAEVDSEANADGAGEGDNDEVEALKAELAKAKEKLNASETEKETIVAELERAAAMGSNFKTPRAQAQFRNTQKPTATQEVTRDSMKDRRAEYKKK